MILFRALFWLIAVAVLFPHETAAGRAEVLAVFGAEPAAAAGAGMAEAAPVIDGLIINGLRRRAAEQLRRAQAGMDTAGMDTRGMDTRGMDTPGGAENENLRR